MASVESWNYTNLRLVNDIKSLDKKHETVLKIIDPVIKTCNEDLKQFNIERSQLCRDLRAKIFSLKTDLDEVKATLRGKSTKLSDGSILRFILEEFEMKLTTLKVHTKASAQDIDVQTETAMHDMDNMTKNIDIWLKEEEQEQSTYVAKREEKQKKFIAEMELKKNLEHQRRLGVIEKQIYSLGGQHGGWHFQDHDVFLRVWVQTQTPTAVITRHTISTNDNNNSSSSSSSSSSSNAAGLNIIVDNMSAVIADTVKSSSRRSSHTTGDNSSSDDQDSTAAATVGHSVTTLDTSNTNPGGENELHHTNLDINTSLPPANINIDINTILYQYSIPSTQKSKITRKLGPLLSNKTCEELEDHIDWYLKYLALNQAKKTLVQQWKDSKYSKHESIDKDALTTENSETLNMFSVDSKGGGSMDIERSEEEKKLMKDRIQQWKKEKEDTVKQKKDLESLIQLQKQKDEEEKMKKRNLELKIQVDLWKELQQKEEQELKEMEKFLEPSTALTSQQIEEELKKRQERDLMIAEKRKFILSKVYHDQKTSKADRIQELYANELVAQTLFSHVKRDPQRLIHGTKTSRMNALTSQDLEENEMKRQHASAHSKNVPMTARDLKFTGRATPSWIKPGMR